jgi:hypothetical protein
MSAARGWAIEGRRVWPRRRSAFLEATASMSRAVAIPGTRWGSWTFRWRWRAMTTQASQAIAVQRPSSAATTIQ